MLLMLVAIFGLCIPSALAEAQAENLAEDLAEDPANVPAIEPAEDLADDNASQSLISRDDAARMIIDTLVRNVTENREVNMGLRVNQYPELLDAGTEVRVAAVDGTSNASVLVCENASWLFFLDLAPGAHYAHPTIIAVLDAVSGEIQSMDAQWWPLLAEPVFSDEAAREDPETIIFEEEPEA
ncbi:MAG: hypothetical protein GKC10_08330 [Methanosarcinales archaeon]|nr:hypothetical protein [Methanosarcinales archaeon]